MLLGIGLSDVSLGQLRFLNLLLSCYPMTATPTLNAIDLMKPANAGESTRLLLNVPHVPSSVTLRPSVVCDTSLELVEHTNMIRASELMNEWMCAVGCVVACDLRVPCAVLAA